MYGHTGRSRRAISARAVAFCLVALVSAAAPTASQGSNKVADRVDKHFKPSARYDPFTKSTTTSVNLAPDMEIDGAKCTGDIRVPTFELWLSKIASPGSAATVVLEVDYTGATWLFIDPDSPIQFLVGDSVLSVALSETPSHDLDSRGDIREVAYATPTVEQLRTLGAADSSTMRVAGQRGTCDQRITADDLRRIYLFDQRVLGDSTTRGAATPR